MTHIGTPGTPRPHTDRCLRGIQKEVWELEDELVDEESDCSTKEEQLQWQDGEDAKGRAPVCIKSQSMH